MTSTYPPFLEVDFFRLTSNLGFLADDPGDEHDAEEEDMLAAAWSVGVEGGSEDVFAGESIKGEGPDLELLRNLYLKIHGISMFFSPKRDKRTQAKLLKRVGEGSGQHCCLI